LEYAATHDGDTLWWRKRPEIQGEIPFGKTTARWIVYSRLMIGNQADTLLARIAAGTLAPTRMMIEDDMVTAEQLAELGWVLNEISNCPVLAKFDAPKLSPAVKLAYASAIDVLPPIISVLPDEISYVRKHISTSASKTSLADTINVWATQLLSQIGDANPTWLHWHTAPYAWAFENGGNLWTISSVCTVMWSEDRAAA
jgi:hypothetical protein